MMWDRIQGDAVVNMIRQKTDGDGNLEARFIVAGLDRAEIEISWEDGILTVGGENRDYRYVYNIDVSELQYDDPTDATLKDGILSVTFPAKTKAKTKIAIK